jgi:hypothetical protein
MIVGLRLDRIALEDLGQAAVLAEAAKLDFVMTGDPEASLDEPVGRDALSLASFMMTKTRRIGLVAAVPQSWAPFNVARALASMDRLSGGRCGWWPVPGTLTSDRNAGREAEHLDVVQKLFDSWDDDALVFDRAAALFADRNKVRRIRHAGEHFTVDGPLNAPRPVQGYPVMLQPLVDGAHRADVFIAQTGSEHPTGVVRPDIVVLRERSLDPDVGPRRGETFNPGDCAGFLLHATDLRDIEAFVRDMAPALQAQGFLQADYAPGDFRTRLGLPRPPNRFASGGALEQGDA